MNNNLNFIAICFCLIISCNLFAQRRILDRKLRTNKPTTTKVIINRNGTQKALKPYKEATICIKIKSTLTFGKKSPCKKIPLPKKTIDINRIEEGDYWGWGWIHKKNTTAKNIEGLKGKTNVHYFKNIRKKTFTSFSNDFDHIIVTDTLFAPVSFLNTDGKPRRVKRSYIKIIANCIIYESPIKPASVMLRNKTDYVFSADNIFFKTKNKGLKKMKVGSSPPFVVADVNIKLHKDPFDDNEKRLVNRLFIEIMKQIKRELYGVKNEWEKDKLLIEFQKYRNKIKRDILWKDKDYDKYYDELCNGFDSNYESSIERIRIVNGLNVMVEGKVTDLDRIPFKYYVIPTKATLMPVMDENTGVLNKLGDLHFRATGDSKLALTMDVKLGYQKELLEKATKKLNKVGVTLEKDIPKKIIFIDEQPLQINGETTGEIVPVSSDILKLEMELQDDNLSLIKLMARRKGTTFNINYKAYDRGKELRQKVLFEVTDDILKQIDLENLINEFNIIESNTITDQVKITSHLSASLDTEAEGALNYVEISLEFLFDNEKKIFRGPFKMSSDSVLGSENDILFVKHSEDYSIKVTGKAYYENGEREIKDDFIINSPFIILDEGIFKKGNND